MKSMPRIVHASTAHPNVLSLVRSTAFLLESIPEEYVIGLDRIELIDSSTLPKSERRHFSRRNRKRTRRGCRGTYHQPWNGQPAWIRLMVDEMFKGIPPLILRLGLFRNLIIAHVLYHEIGHHVHFHRPQHDDKEAVAEQYRLVLTRQMVKRRYAFLKPFVFIIRWAYLGFKWLRSRFTKDSR